MEKVDRAKLVSELISVTEWQAVRPDEVTINHLVSLCRRSLHALLEPEQDVRALMADSLRLLATSIDRGNLAAGLLATKDYDKAAGFKTQA